MHITRFILLKNSKNTSDLLGMVKFISSHAYLMGSVKDREFSQNYAKLRSLGYVNSGFIDDSLLCGDSFKECTENVNATTNLMTRVGFMINEEKSVSIPTTRIHYLGNIIDSEKMIVCLPENGQEAIIHSCTKSEASIREVAQVIGQMVACCSAVEYGKLHYRQLKVNHGNYDARMQITMFMKTKLSWWVDNLTFQVRHILREPSTMIIHTDASLCG